MDVFSVFFQIGAALAISLFIFGVLPVFWMMNRRSKR